jgi:hypothetical protein
MGGQAPQTLRPGEVWPPSGWLPVARMSGRRPRRSSPVRVLCPPCGCPSNRSRGRPVSMRPVSMRPVSTRPVPSRCPDGRPSGVRGSAAALSGPRWTLEWLGAVGRPRWGQWVRGAAVVRGRRGRLPAWGLTGRDGAGLAVGGWHEGRRQTWAAASQAHRLGRRLAAWPIRELVQRQGVGRLAGGHENTQVLTSSRQVCPGQVAGVVPDHGLDREVVTTLRGRWLVIVLCRQFQRPIRLGRGADCGRSAAAAREECCPSGADRGLTSRNGGGRDRV